MSNTTTILAELMKYMNENNLNISDLARVSNMNPGTISSLVNGNRKFSVYQLDRITETMGHPIGYYYERYITEYLGDSTPNWRRTSPFLESCAKLNKLDCIHQVVHMLMDKLGYADPLFELAERLFQDKLYKAASILYENVALSENKQHSERLALCQYRLFQSRQEDDQERSYEAAVQFETYIDRLDEIFQLDALKDLVNTYRTLRKWEKVDKFAKTLGNLSEAKMKLERKRQSVEEDILKNHSSPPTFAYWAFSHLLQAEVCYVKKDYEQALKHNYAYSDLSWVKETDESSLKWKHQYETWAKANIYVNKLMSGQESVLPDYVAYFSSRKDEILTALDNIIDAANQYNINVDDILKQFESEILSLLEEQKGGGVYNQQFITERFTHFSKELAVYYLHKGMFSEGFRFLLTSLEKSAAINNKSYIIICVRLFESYRKYAPSETKAAYRNLISEVKVDVHEE
ncbi:helix-turn-helix transcriptional regulator [Paenibacillus polymyxa]|uniref:helix-turn-helix domain-containing protein n=1 Tax=Paenibacillus polymyxa TaxID=1406 RepID=UPI002AB412FF|nr:helix-turn-helix transcriptional regulator [Paenibacillus polymyxa]MDY7991288.1 helix-turn-helix transcriptional regulator [Paenibacillus polymyxa]MDY8117728.1 helix-turn-helix transcriptional regulator [Paenibacillus polymyxa]